MDLIYQAIILSIAAAVVGVMVFVDRELNRMDKPLPEPPAEPPALTQWYGKDTVPGQVGVYKTRRSNKTVGYSYFSGEGWGCQNDSPDLAVKDYEQYKDLGDQDKEWQGYMSDPA